MAGTEDMTDASVLAGDWIPVSWTAEAPPELRQRSALGLRELLEHAHLVKALEVTVPPALSALYRLLYVLAARVTGTAARPGLDIACEDEEFSWLDRRREVLAGGRFAADGIEAYFARFPDRFDLFDTKRPFLQDPRLAQQCPKSSGVNKLVVGRASGSNHSWFGGHHFDDDPLAVSAQQAFLNLLVSLSYGPSGRCSTRVVGDVNKADTRVGPLRAALSYHPVGKNLFHTLIAGIPRPDRFDGAEDHCPWEQAQLTEPLSPPTVSGLGSWLTGRSQHAVLLVPDQSRTRVVDAYVTWAFRETVIGDEANTDGIGDPLLIWQTSKKGDPYARRADAGRALWRDLDSLIGHKPADSAQPRRPPVFSDLPALPGLRVQALGFDQVREQARDNQFVSALTPPVFDLYQDDEIVLRQRVGDLRVAAEGIGQRLDAATKKAWAAFTAGKISDCSWSEQAAARYWPEAEKEFWRRLTEREFDGLWFAFRQIAEPIFTAVTRPAKISPRGTRAVERARTDLYGRRRAAN